jgi:hypothetical protein
MALHASERMDLAALSPVWRESAFAVDFVAPLLVMVRPFCRYSASCELLFANLNTKRHP